MFDLRPAVAADGPAIDALLDRCFGPARRNRTAYRLRDCAAPLSGLSLVACVGDRLAGSVQLWPVELRATNCGVYPLVLLGPLAVDTTFRGAGLGAAVMIEALARADVQHAGAIVLIGDESYYRRFGFAAAATGGWQLPGPVDRARLLLRGGANLPLTATLGPVRAPVPLAA